MRSSNSGIGVMSMVRGMLLRLVAVVLSTLIGATIAVAEPIRLGWQVPWATQGQLVMALKYTTIPEVVGSELQYVGFPYGGPLNRAALAGEVDVLFTADQPALILLSKGDRFVIVGRLMYNRTCLYVHPQSPVASLKDLKGKTVSGPVGAAAERVAIRALKDAGVGSAEIRSGNLDMAPQVALLKSNKDRAAWPGVDALYGFDPFPAVFESARLARMLHCGNVVSVVVASREMVEKRRPELVRFLRGLSLAWYYYSQHPAELNAWFITESRLDADSQALQVAAAVEPNITSKTFDDVRLTLTQEDFSVLDQALSFLIERKFVDGQFDFRKSIEMGPLKAALAWPESKAAYSKVAPSGKRPQ